MTNNPEIPLSELKTRMADKPQTERTSELVERESLLRQIGEKVGCYDLDLPETFKARVKELVEAEETMNVLRHAGIHADAYSPDRINAAERRLVGLVKALEGYIELLGGSENNDSANCAFVCQTIESVLGDHPAPEQVADASKKVDDSLRQRLGQIIQDSGILNRLYTQAVVYVDAPGVSAEFCQEATEKLIAAICEVVGNQPGDNDMVSAAPLRELVKAYRAAEKATKNSVLKCIILNIERILRDAGVDKEPEANAAPSQPPTPERAPSDPQP